MKVFSMTRAITLGGKGERERGREGGREGGEGREEREREGGREGGRE